MTRLWIEDLRELLVFDIWPCPDDTYIEKINAISRFVLMSTCILAVHRKSARLFVAGILLSVAIALHVKPDVPTGIPVEEPVKELVIEQTEPVKEVEETTPVEYIDGIDSFAHFVYGDINRNNKQN